MEMYEKPVVAKYVKVDGYEFKLRTLLEALDNLLDSDYFSYAIGVDDFEEFFALKGFSRPASDMFEICCDPSKRDEVKEFYKELVILSKSIDDAK